MKNGFFALRKNVKDWLLAIRGSANDVLVDKATRVALRIHIGCGPIDLPGWVNLDARPFLHVHLVTDSVMLPEFAEGAVGEIYLCHVLEHFSFEDVESLLANYHKKLAVGGVLRISVPDFDLAIAAYNATNRDLEFVRMALMGGQDYEFNFHKSIFNKELLANLLKEAGFREIHAWEVESDFGQDIGDWSSGLLKKKGVGSFPISLNLKAIK